MQRPLSTLAVPAVLLALTACAGSGHGGGARGAGLPHFPSANELQQISAAAPRTPTFPSARTIDRWVLADPLPTTLGTAPHETTSAAGNLLATTYAGDARIRPSAGMQCIAREYGRFILAHQAMPAPELATFFQARCGEPVGKVAVLTHRSPEPGASTLAGSWRAAAEDLVRGLPVSGPTAVGLWAGEDEGGSIVVAAVGERVLEIEPLAIDAGDDGAIDIRGRFLVPTGGSEAFVTRGDYGFGECQRVPGVELPRFRFLCAIDTGDPTVTVEILTHEPGRLLGHRAMIGLLAPGKAAPAEYAARGLARAETPMPHRDRAALLAAIDGLRTALGMTSLRLAEAQSTTAERLLPHYVAAVHGGDPKLADTIALGMMAGWDVRGGMIRDADFVSLDLFGSSSMDLALEAVLMSPSQRAVLLEPRAHAIAVATRDDDAGRVTSALVTTYRFFGDTDYQATEQALLDKLDGERAAAGKPPVIRVNGNSARPLAAARVAVHGGEDVDDALRTMLQEIVGETGMTMQGTALHTTDLNSMTFPRELVQSERVQIDVDLSHYQPKGSPWGMFLVLMLFTTA